MRAVIGWTMAVLAAGQVGAVELKLKWEPGKRYLFEQESTSALTMTLPGKGEIKTNSFMVQETHSDVSTHEKGFRVTSGIDRIRMKTTMGAVTASEFDSADPDKSGGMMGDMLKPLLAASFDSIYSPDGEFLEIQGLDKIQDAAQLGLGKEQLEQMAKETSRLLPRKAVEPGDTWTTRLDIPLKPISKEPAVLKMTLKLESVGREDGKNIARVSMTGTLEMKIKEGGDSVLSLEARKVEGSLIFDLDLGQPLETRTAMDLELGLPAGAPRKEGAPGKMPLQTLTVSRLKAVEKL